MSRGFRRSCGPLGSIPDGSIRDSGRSRERASVESGFAVAKGTFNVDTITVAVSKNSNQRFPRDGWRHADASKGDGAGSALAVIGNSIASPATWSR